MKKILCILCIYCCAAALLLLSGCSEDTDPRKSSSSQKKKNIAQQHAQQQQSVSDSFERATASSVWPPSEMEQENILPADQWSRKNYMMIFDGSGSMGERRCSGNRTKSAVAKEAMSDWAQSVPADANLGLVVFDKQGFAIRLQLGQGDRQKFVQQVKTVVLGSRTPLTQAVRTAYELLTAQAKKQLGYGEYHMVIVTDGAANEPEKLTGTVNAVLAYSPIIISTIGFCIADTHSLNQPGRTIYKAANNPEALRQGLQDVLAESKSFDDVTEF
jgi:Ca-activated chloride channel family protein